MTLSRESEGFPGVKYRIRKMVRAVPIRILFYPSSLSKVCSFLLHPPADFSSCSSPHLQKNDVGYRERKFKNQKIAPLDRKLYYGIIKVKEIMGEIKVAWVKKGGEEGRKYEIINFPMDIGRKGGEDDE